MFHMELYTSTVATGATAFQQLTYFATDAILPQLNNGMQVSPDLPFIHSFGGIGLNLCDIRMQSGSLQTFPFPTQTPNNRGTGFESPPRWWDWSKYPYPLKPTEEFDIYVTQNSGGNEIEYVAVMFCDGIATPIATPINPVGLRDQPTTPGRMFTAHATSGTALVGGGWTQIQPIFDQSLYAGYYALLGMRVLSATGLFFRMYPSMGPKWRPGGIMVNAYDQLDPPGQRFFPGWLHGPMGWGAWMTFYQNVPPKVEMFSTANDATQEFWYDMLYLGPQTTPAI